MELVGIRRKSTLCKICLSFDDETLNEITLDILLNRRTYKQIREFYSPKLPPGVAKLNDVNINNHRKHSDPGLLAEKILKEQNKPTDSSGVISKLFAERFKEKIDSQNILMETYRERLNNLFIQQKILNRLIQDVDKLRVEAKAEKANELQIKTKEKEIIELSTNIDKIFEGLQGVVIRENNANKGIGEGAVFITQNFVSIFQVHLKEFLDDIIPQIMVGFFGDKPSDGQRLVKLISKSMDEHLIPAFDATNIIDKKRVN